MKITSKNDKRQHRHRRVRAKIFGTVTRPRLSVFKSNKDIYVQLIDDVLGKTLAAASSSKMKGKVMLEKAKTVGDAIAKVAKEKGIKKVVFDRSGYIYTGKIKALADAARVGGLEF